MTTPEIPKELFSRKNFFTLSGAAGAVWVFCLVLSRLDGGVIPDYIYKYIALGLSEVLAIYMVVRDKRKTNRENYFIAIFNGLLIFINASGFNAASTNLLFAERPDASASMIYTETQSFNANFMALSLFYNEPDWWPNKKQQKRIQKLEEKILALEGRQINEENQEEINKEIDALLKENNSLQQELERCIASKADTPIYSAADIEYLNSEREKCRQEQQRYRKLYLKASTERKRARDSLKLCVKFKDRLSNIN